MGFPRQEYGSGLPLPSPGDLPHPRMEPASLMPPALTGGYFITPKAGLDSTELGAGPVTDHALITWLSCTAHVADHALIT